ncbi:MAG: tetraacyldisaccharide 4'-kinase [Campylobacterales bacterium]
MIQKIEDIFFRFNRPWHYVAALILFPFSLIYCVVAIAKKLTSNPKEYGIPVISIGNLTVGGSGKTPFAIELCKRFERPCVVMRGYGRRSKGLLVVSRFGNIERDVFDSGDEAMLIAKKAAHASVVVSEDRAAGIEEAKRLGADVVILDDGFGKFGIKKLDILLFPKTRFRNIFCLPAGPFRFPLFFGGFADISAVEGVDFVRNTTVPNGESFVLVTAIANPQRLDSYLPTEVVAKYYFADHYYFAKRDIAKIRQKHPNATVLCTEKDGVKLDVIGESYVEIGLALEFEENFEKFLNSKIAALSLKNQAS